MKEKIKKFLKTKTGRRVFAALSLAFAILGAVAIISLASTYMELRSAQEGYAGLRGFPQSESGEDPENNTISGPEAETEQAFGPSADLLNINEDYIGWIRIDGTSIDYPVTQCGSNEKYLYWTFWDEQNIVGCIFMDSRLPKGFEGPLAILYGHNSRDGSMFAPLYDFFDTEFLDSHSEVTIYMLEGGEVVYHIFAAIKTDVNDPIFQLFDGGAAILNDYFSRHGSPEGMKHFLVMSTCTKSDDDDERYLVLAARP